MSTGRMNERGFTLIEVLAVLVLTAAAFALVLPGLASGTENLQARQARGRILETVNRARMEAVRTNQPAEVFFSGGGQCVRFTYDGQPMRTPFDRRVFFMAGSEEVRIVFLGDGTSTGGEVEFKDAHGTGYVLTADKSNGRCHFEKR